MKVDCTVLKFNKEEDSLTIPLAVLSVSVNISYLELFITKALTTQDYQNEM